MSDGDQILLPQEDRFGRHVWHDPGNRDYPIRPLLEGRAEIPPNKVWWARHCFNQLGPSCTMQAAYGVLISSPFRKVAQHRAHFYRWDTEAERHAGYKVAQDYDPWPGSNYDGSSTDAPFKMFRAMGVIDGWRWCFGLQDVLDTLRKWGPVAFGTNWYPSMDRLDENHRITEIAGDPLGGHAYEILYDDRGDRELVGVQSWGEGIGARGRFRLPYEHADRLLGERGEACTIVVA